MKKIVLTGGPGAGKTVICAALAAAHPDRFVHVPESATQIYNQLGSRWDRMDKIGQRHAQRLIYQNQVKQESEFAAKYPEKTLLLDRGTIDGSAYWPDGPEAYWQDLGKNLDDELNRYDAVIFLETAATLGIYDGDRSNSVRFEAPEAAIESGKKLRHLWDRHPHIHSIAASPDISKKIAAVTKVLNTITA
jgi:predicted ATPase